MANLNFDDIDLFAEPIETLFNYPVRSKMTLTEIINHKKLKIIVENFQDFHGLSHFKDCKNGFKIITDSATKLSILKARLSNKKNDINYIASEKNPGGRLFARGSSCQGLPKEFKYLICHDDFGDSLYIDIDIVNAHPIFEKWYCVKNNIETPALDLYIKDRESILLSVCEHYSWDRDSAKELFLKMLNGGGSTILKDVPKHPFLLDFYLEQELIRDFVAENRPDLYKKAKHNLMNQKGSCINYLFCEIENRVLQCIYDYCYDNNIQVGVLSFDGCMVYRNDVDDLDSLLDILTQHVFLTLGIKVDIIEKKLPNPLVDWDKYDKTKLNELEISILHQITDEDCGKYVIEKLIHDETIKYDKDEDILYVWDEKKKLYKKQDKIFLMTLISGGVESFLTTDDLKNYDNNPDISKTTKTEIRKRIATIKSTKIQNYIYTQMRIRLQDDSIFIRNNFDMNPNLVPLRNGLVFDITNCSTRDRVKTDYFTNELDWDYNPDVNVEEIRMFIREFLIPKNKVLDKNDQNHIDCFLLSLGYCISGYNNQKAIFIYIGPKNAGKTTLCNKLKPIFGFLNIKADKKVVCKSKTDSVHTAELIPLVRKRVGMVPELEETDVPNGTFLKDLSGLERNFSGRRCGGRDQLELIFMLKLIIATNYCFLTSDPALLERLKSFNFPNSFSKHDMTPEKEQYIKDLDLASVILKYAHRFYLEKNIVWSKQVDLATIELTSEIDPIKSFFRTTYELSDNKNDRIEKQNIWGIFLEAFPSSKSIGRNSFYRKFEDNLTQPIELYRRTHYQYLKLKRYDNSDDSDDDSIQEIPVRSLLRK